MSASLFLLPLAVAVITISAEQVSNIISACENKDRGMSEKIQTKFNSEDLLKKTLAEHGVSMQIKSANHIIADFGAGKISFERESVGSPYTMQVFDVENIDDIACNIRAIDQEYGSNVQSYTYHRLKEHLPENMRMQSEQVLEDNSILITLSVD